MKKKEPITILVLIAALNLLFCSCSEDSEAVDFLLEKGVISSKEEINFPEGSHAFCQAIFEGDMETALAFCKAGIDVNAENKDSDSPLQFAAFWGNERFLKLLIVAGAKVNASPWCSPLVQAAANGHVGCVKILIEAGADVNERVDTNFNSQHKTPLMWAASEGHADCVKLLLDAGADVNMHTKKGYSIDRSALSCAMGCDDYICMPLDEKSGPINTMPIIYANAKSSTNRVRLWVNHPYTKCVCYGRRLDAYFMGKGSEECARLLIEAGADLSPFSGDTEYLVWYAAKHGYDKTLKKLLDAGWSANFETGNGTTPLMIAAENGNIECVRLLLMAGADVNARNKSGKSAYEHASTKEVRETLRSAGAK